MQVFSELLANNIAEPALPQAAVKAESPETKASVDISSNLTTILGTPQSLVAKYTNYISMFWACQELQCPFSAMIRYSELIKLNHEFALSVGAQEISQLASWHWPEGWHGLQIWRRQSQGSSC